MRSQAFNHLILRQISRSLSVLAATSTLMASVGFSIPATAATGTDSSSMIIKVPNGDGAPINVKVTLPKGDPVALKRVSPSELSKKNAALQNYMASQCSGRGNVVQQVLREFPLEAGAFYTGVAMSAQLDLQKDPAALKHFYEHSLVDASAQASFAFFMLGSRMTQSSLAMAGIHFDPCHGLKIANGEFETKTRIDLARGRVEQDVQLKGIRPTPLQIRSSYLVGPLSMGVGFFVSSLAQEFLTDKNITMCAKGKIEQLNAADKKVSDKACEDGWNEWVSTGKISKYVPDLMSMTLTSFVQGYVINMGMGALVGKGQQLVLDKAKGAIAGIAMNEMVSDGVKKVSLNMTLRTIMLVTGVTPGGAVVRFGLQALQAMVFVSVNQFILPYVKMPWETWRQGTDITASIDGIYKELDRAEKNKWIAMPKVSPVACSLGAQPIPDIGTYLAAECNEVTPSLGDLVRQLGVKYKKWRETALADAYAAHGNWKDYLTRFENTYVDSRNFYEDLLKLITDKDTPEAQQDELHLKLYQRAPFNGINAKVPADVCSMDPKDLAVFKQAETLAQQALDDRTTGKVRAPWGSNENEVLGKIIIGLHALDCRGDKETKASARTALFEQAMDALNLELKKRGSGLGSGASAHEQDYALLQNPFLPIAKVLGSPKPLAAGMVYLLETNSDNTIIDQKLKDDHPGKIGDLPSAATPTMVDYLLASMACGPEAELIKNNSPVQRPRSLSEKALGWLGYDTQLGNQDSLVNIEYGGKDPSAGSRLNEKVWEIRAAFHPPRIIAANVNPCNGDWPAGVRRDQPLWDIHQAQFNVDGKNYQGLLEIVKNFARSGVIGKNDNGYSFATWWSANVEPHVLQTVNLFAADFQHIIDDKFIPALTSKDSKDYNGRKFEIGVANSLQAEAKYNLLLVGKSLQLKQEAKTRQDFVKLASLFLKRLQLQTDLFADVHTADRAVLEIENKTLPDDAFPTAQPAQAHMTPGQSRYNQAFDRNKRFLQEILAKIDEVAAAAQVPEALTSLKEIRSAARENLDGIVTETDSYFGIVDTARLPGIQ